MLKLLGLGVVIAMGVAAAAWAQAPAKYDGQYVGSLTLTGIISGDCTRPPVGAEYPLSIRNGVVHFKYVPRFDTELIGHIDANGSFKAVGDTKHSTVTMTGQITGYHNLTAKLVSPSCQYTFEVRN